MAKTKKIEENNQNLSNNDFSEHINFNQTKLEINLVENVGGMGGFWSNMRLSLRKINGGGRGSRDIFLNRKT